MTILSIDAKQRLDRYLSEVAEALRSAGHDPLEIENVVASLREQIYDLATPSGRQSVSVSDIENALSQLEPPDVYSVPPVDTSGVERQRSLGNKRALSYVSVFLSIGGVLIATALNAGLWLPQFVGPIFGLTQVIGLAAGLAAWSETLGRFGAFCAALFLFFGLLTKYA